MAPPVHERRLQRDGSFISPQSPPLHLFRTGWHFHLEKDRTPGADSGPDLSNQLTTNSFLWSAPCEISRTMVYVSSSVKASISPYIMHFLTALSFILSLYYLLPPSSPCSYLYSNQLNTNGFFCNDPLVHIGHQRSQSPPRLCRNLPGVEARKDSQVHHLQDFRQP